MNDARTCVLTALLDPEEAFEGTIEMVPTHLGNLHITQNRLKLVFTTEDEDVPHYKAGEGFKTSFDLLQAFLSALAWVTDISVGHEFFDYVEFFGDGALFWSTALPGEQPQRRVDSNALSSTQELLPLVMSDAHLRWALEDYRTAVKEPGHAVIFLYRSIEWLRVRFDGWEKAWKAIGSSEKEFRAIKEPANDYYLARHAQKGGPRPVPEQVRDKALKNTKTILQRYIDYLRSESISRT